MYVLFGVQLAAALYLKHESTLYRLYIIPITGALLCAVSLYHFPTRCTFKIVLASGLFAVYLLWFASMYCLLIPGACPDTVPISMFSPSVDYKAELKRIQKALGTKSEGPPALEKQGQPRPPVELPSDLPFAIDESARDQWMLCMRQALAEQVADPALREVVERAFIGMAEHMVNTGSAAGCPR